jgi:hypothetical protein
MLAVAAPSGHLQAQDSSAAIVVSAQVLDGLIVQGHSDLDFGAIPVPAATDITIAIAWDDADAGFFSVSGNPQARVFIEAPDLPTVLTMEGETEGLPTMPLAMALSFTGGQNSNDRCDEPRQLNWDGLRTDVRLRCEQTGNPGQPHDGRAAAYFWLHGVLTVPARAVPGRYSATVTLTAEY